MMDWEDNLPHQLLMRAGLQIVMVQLFLMFKRLIKASFAKALGIW